MFGPMTPDEAMELITQLSVAVGILMLALILMYIRLGPPPAPSAPGKDETVLVGLAGGICSGKSSITAALREIPGVVVVDADVLGHEAYPLVQSQLVAAFGEGILMPAPDGEDGDMGGMVVNRRALGPLVFGNKANMEKLQNIMWPQIRTMIAERMRAAVDGGAAMVVVEAAVMIEAKWTDLFHLVVVSTVEPEVALERLIARNGLDKKAAQARLDSQLSNAERLKRADIVVENSGSATELAQRCKALHAELLALAEQRRASHAQGIQTHRKED